MLLKASKTVYFRIVSDNGLSELTIDTIKHDLVYLNFLDFTFQNFSLSLANVR